MGVVNAIGDRLPKGWGDAFRQIGLFVLADLCYETVRGIAEGKASVGVRQRPARSSTSSRPPAPSSSRASRRCCIGDQWLIDFANLLYMNSHFVITTAFLVWLYLFRNDSFYFVRNMFMVAMALALVGYTLFPTAPPRLFPEYGFVDTITDFSSVNHDSALVKIFVNPYAAVPSMHIAFALMIGVPGVRLSRHLVSQGRSGRSSRCSSSGWSSSPATTTGSTPRPVRWSPASRRSSPSACWPRTRPEDWSWHPRPSPARG